MPRPTKKPKTPPAASSDGALLQLAEKAKLNSDQIVAARAWLAEQLVAAEFAKLGQGGYTESKVPLQRVFVDLPASERAGQTEADPGGGLFLAELMELGARPLRTARTPGGARVLLELDTGATCDDGPLEFETRGEQGRRSPVGFLLIGGPGQGKSTLGQLGCQLHRAALLLPHREALDHGARTALDPFAPPAKPTKGQHIALPSEPLLPLAIPLPDLSAWLASSPPHRLNAPTLLRFIAEQASAKKSSLDAATLLAMVRAWPVLLLLDGFDEVGSREDRERIVSLVRELLGELAPHVGQVQILATTRPQGYAGELDRIGAPLAHRHLIPLGVGTALRYAERLVEAKVHGADLQQKVLNRLRQAANEPATARLMSSPLQVTILAALVQTGSAPRERWTLFKSYFEFTYRREIDRDSYASPLLVSQRGHIEQVHRRVGLLLQVESEEAGGASARLSRERLEAITDTVLRDDEVAADERTTLVRQIVDAAERRLVFLVEPEPGAFGFEIRSLQEFMAAWALTEGPEASIEARLLQIAPAPMFRNTLLFVASRLYSEAHALRDRIADSLCRALDEDPGDSLSRLSHAGALLALETLEEGAALPQPKRARALMTRAVGLLELPPGPEHGRLARVCNDDTRDVLVDALRRRLLDVGERSDSLAAWVCLTECCNRGRDWASKLCGDAWPGVKEPRRILEAIYGAGVEVRPWLAERLEASANRVPAESVAGWHGPGQPEEPLPGWFGVLWGQEPSRTDQGLHLIRDDGVRPARQAPPNPPPERWRPWCAVAGFAANPSASTLAEAIEQIRESAPPEEWKELAWFAPWPLAACLRWAECTDDLTHIKSLMLSRTMGDIQDWLNAQRAWAADDFANAVQELVHPTSEDLPWRPLALHSGPPLASGVLVDFRGHVSANDLAQVAASFRSARRAVTRERLADLCLELLRKAPAQPQISGAEVASWISASGTGCLWLIPKPLPLADEDWLALLREAPEGYDAWASGALDAVVTHPDVPVLLRAALIEILWFPGDIERTAEISSLLATLAEKLRAQSFDRLTARVDAALLRLLAGHADPELMEDLVKAAPSMNTQTLDLVDSVLVSPPSWAQVNVRPDPLLEALLSHQAGDGWRSVGSQTLMQCVRHALQSRRSNLGPPATWRRLALPDPLPASPASRRGPTAIPAAPVVLQSLQARDLRGLRDLSLTLTPPLPGQGQWTVLLGPNGAGKTTLLRALVLSLRNLRDPAIWPKGAFSTPWIRAGADKPAQITVRVDDLDRTVIIRPNGSERREQSPEQNRPRLFPLFAYGCRRGSALGGNARAVDINDDGGPEVATLFDEGAGLVHAETWLMQWEGDALKNPKSRPIYDAICAGLCQLLDIKAINVRDRRLWVIEGDRPPLPLEAMSDGYLTTAGWFIDLIARWIELAARHGVAIDGDFMKRMTGLVLLDEIDLHLHPRWQVEVIRRTRALLPRMSFVVTTHNPLTLVGARPEEIWILSERDSEIVANQSQEAPMLLTGGQIFSRYFGIDSVFPHELGQKLNRYGYLSGYAARSDEEQVELERLRSELRAAGVEPGWEEAPRRVTTDEDLDVFKARTPHRKKRPSP